MERVTLLTTLLPDYFLYRIQRPDTPERSTIVFVGTVMHARIGRMAKWLKRKYHYQVVLICEKQGFATALTDPAFDETFLFRNKFHLHALLKKFQGEKVIIHAFGPPHLAAYETLYHHRASAYLFDYQDLMITNFGLNAPFAYMKKDIRRERIILAEADGIIANSLELQTAKKYYEKISKRKLYFPLYTDNDKFLTKVFPEPTAPIHLVYVGGVHSKFQNSDYFGGQQLHWLIEKLNRQKIHFHIYPAPTNRPEHLVDYIEYDEKLHYFHLHSPVSQQELIKEVNQYDYGIIPFFHRTNKKLNDKRYYSTALKLFNFYEAGIPIIMGKDTTFQNFIGRRFGGVVSLAYEEFDQLAERLQGIDYNKMIETIHHQRQLYSLKERIGELTKFYNNT